MQAALTKAQKNMSSSNDDAMNFTVQGQQVLRTMYESKLAAANRRYQEAEVSGTLGCVHVGSARLCSYTWWYTTAKISVCYGFVTRPMTPHASCSRVNALNTLRDTNSQRLPLLGALSPAVL